MKYILILLALFTGTAVFSQESVHVVNGNIFIGKEFPHEPFEGMIRDTTKCLLCGECKGMAPGIGNIFIGGDDVNYTFGNNPFAMRHITTTTQEWQFYLSDGVKPLAYSKCYTCPLVVLDTLGTISRMYTELKNMQQQLITELERKGSK